MILLLSRMLLWINCGMLIFIMMFCWMLWCCLVFSVCLMLGVVMGCWLFGWFGVYFMLW